MGRGAERKIVQNTVFHGKRHDNIILKVNILLSRNFVVMAQAPNIGIHPQTHFRAALKFLFGFSGFGPCGTSDLSQLKKAVVMFWKEQQDRWGTVFGATPGAIFRDAFPQGIPGF